MDAFTAWASLYFLSIATVAIISIWRAIMYIFNLTETLSEKGAEMLDQREKGW